MTDLRQEHGRLVARVLKLIAKLERSPSDERRVQALATVTDLIVLEARMEDPLAPPVEPSWDDVRARLALMRRGAGLVVPS